MKPLKLAKRYMNIVFEGEDLDDLRPLFTEDLVFRGPLYEFDSADTYIASLKKEPPKGFQYSLIKSYGDDTSACLIYRFSKPGVATIMAQLFEIRDTKISKISLIFDTRAFYQQ